MSPDRVRFGLVATGPGQLEDQSKRLCRARPGNDSGAGLSIQRRAVRAVGSLMANRSRQACRPNAYPQDGPRANEPELRATASSVRALAPSHLPSAEGKVDASIGKPTRRARAARTAGTRA